jgi:hypothetical protein
MTSQLERRFEDVLSCAERRLLELAAALDVPIDGRSPESVLVLGVTRQAAEVYAVLRRECLLGETTSALVLVRAVVEAMILTRWLELDPGLHVALYQADDDERRLTAAKRWEELVQRRGNPLAKPVFAPQAAASMRDQIAIVRRRARDAGRKVGERGLLPPLEQMATETHDTAVWEGYQGIYRLVSPWTHFGGRSLVGHAFERRADGVHLSITAAYDPLSVRSIAAPSVAILLGSASRQCGLAIESECRAIQDAVAQWRPEASTDSSAADVRFGGDSGADSGAHSEVTS